jgi:hypothetical protein
MTKIRLDELKAALEQRRPAVDRSEADYKRRLVAEVKALGGHARRIEDRWAVGVLDMIIKFPDHNVVMAEGKVIDGFLFAPSPSQYLEGLKWQAVHVQCVLIGWKHRQMYVSPWVEKADCRECFMRIGLSGAEMLQEYLKK